MSKVFHLEINGRHSYYTTLSGLCSVNNIGVSKFTLDRYDFKEPYKNDICIIRKGILNIGSKIKLPNAQVKRDVEDRYQLVKVSEKINLFAGNYVKKADFYYFNFDGHIYKGSANLEFWTFGLTRLKNSKKILGEIKDIMF